MGGFFPRSPWSNGRRINASFYEQSCLEQKRPNEMELGGGGYNVFVFLSKVFSFVRNVNVKSPSGKQTLLLLSVTKICRRV